MNPEEDEWYAREIEEDDIAAIEEITHGYDSPCDCSWWAGYYTLGEIIYDPYPLRKEMFLGCPDEVEEVCLGSCDLPISLQHLMSKAKHEDIDMSRIAELLHLQQDASENEVYQAVKNLKERLDLAETKLMQIEAEKFIANNKDRIFDPEGFKRLYLRYGKEVAEGFLKVFTAQS